MGGIQYTNRAESSVYCRQNEHMLTERALIVVLKIAISILYIFPMDVNGIISKFNTK